MNYLDNMTPLQLKELINRHEITARRIIYRDNLSPEMRIIYNELKSTSNQILIPIIQGTVYSSFWVGEELSNQKRRDMLSILNQRPTGTTHSYPFDSAAKLDIEITRLLNIRRNNLL